MGFMASGCFIGYSLSSLPFSSLKQTPFTFSMQSESTITTGFLGSDTNPCLQDFIFYSNCFLMYFLEQSLCPTCISYLLPFSPPGHIPNPGIKTTSLGSPALQGILYHWSTGKVQLCKKLLPQTSSLRQKTLSHHFCGSRIQEQVIWWVWLMRLLWRQPRKL